MNYNLNSQRKRKDFKKKDQKKQERKQKRQEFREAHNAVSLDSPLTSSHRESIHLDSLEIGDDIDDRPCLVYI